MGGVFENHVGRVAEVCGGAEAGSHAEKAIGAADESELRGEIESEVNRSRDAGAEREPRGQRIVADEQEVEATGAGVGGEERVPRRTVGVALFDGEWRDGAEMDADQATGEIRARALR